MNNELTMADLDCVAGGAGKIVGTIDLGPLHITIATNGVGVTLDGFGGLSVAGGNGIICGAVVGPNGDGHTGCIP